jgi:hypothetical protein
MGNGDWLDLLDDKLPTPARQAAARDSGDNSNADVAATSMIDVPAAPVVMPSSRDAGVQTLDTSSRDVAPRAPVDNKAARRGGGDAIKIRIALSAAAARS